MNKKREELTYQYWVDVANLPQPSIVLRQLSNDAYFPAIFPELHVLKEVPQDLEYHPEGNVFEHSLQAMDVARTLTEGLPEQDRFIVVLAALCHDFGKATHTRVKENGRITAYKHAEAGVIPAGLFLSRFDTPDFIVKAIQALVQEHMVHTNKCTPKTMRRLKKSLHGVGLSVKHLALLVDSDTGGRSTASWMGYGEELLAVERIVIERDNSLKSSGKLDGKFLIGLGLKPSPVFKSLITEYNQSGLDLPENEMKDWVLSRVNSQS